MGGNGEDGSDEISRLMNLGFDELVGALTAEKLISHNLRNRVMVAEGALALHLHNRDSGQSAAVIEFKDIKGVSAQFLVPAEFVAKFGPEAMYDIQQTVLDAYRTKLRELNDKSRVG